MPTSKLVEINRASSAAETTARRYRRITVALGSMRSAKVEASNATPDMLSRIVERATKRGRLRRAISHQATSMNRAKRRKRARQKSSYFTSSSGEIGKRS